MVRRYCTIARLARITISASTTISSMIVKPRLPVLVLRPIEPSSVGSGVHVEHVLPAPGGRVGFVLVRPETPFGGAGHRVDRNSPQETDLAAGDVVGRRHALDQHLEVLRVAFAARLDLER